MGWGAGEEARRGLLRDKAGRARLEVPGGEELVSGSGAREPRKEVDGNPHGGGSGRRPSAPRRVVGEGAGESYRDEEARRSSERPGGATPVLDVGPVEVISYRGGARWGGTPGGVVVPAESSANDRLAARADRPGGF